jgi:hypothetical protein
MNREQKTAPGSGYPGHVPPRPMPPPTPPGIASTDHFGLRNSTKPAPQRSSSMNAILRALLRTLAGVFAAAVLIALLAALAGCGGGDPDPACEPFVGPVDAAHPPPPSQVCQ